MPKSKRKNDSKVEVIEFNPEARKEFLTGFHKRKLARIKAAQALALEKAKEEHREFRKQLREQREEDAVAIQKALKAQMAEMNGEVLSDSDSEMDSGEEIVTVGEVEEKVEEYVTESEGEEKHATVLIEPIRLGSPEEEEEGEAELERDASGRVVKEKYPQPKGKDEKKKKEKKKNHRYLSKGERKDDRRKQSAKRSKMRAKFADEKGTKLNTKGARTIGNKTAKGKVKKR